MARRAMRSQFNGARRRKRLRQAAGNERWLHLCAGRASAQETQHIYFERVGYLFSCVNDISHPMTSSTRASLTFTLKEAI